MEKVANKIGEDKKNNVVDKASLIAIKEHIYLSWLRDMDKVNVMKELSIILEEIENSNSIEEYFSNDSDTYTYFINAFSPDVLTNILIQPLLYGENANEEGIKVLFGYLSIFVKFMENHNYNELFKTIKNFFDANKSFYR